MKKYIYFVPREKMTEIDKLGSEPFTDVLEDAETKEQFRAKMLIANSLEEGYDQLELRSFVIGKLPDGRYVKILEREEDEAGVTIFESKRGGERRGHMLRSMLTEEEKKEVKEKTMSEELERRREWRKEVTKKILDKD